MRSDESEGRVVVEGVASAPNACYTALVSLGRTGDGGGRLRRDHHRGRGHSVTSTTVAPLSVRSRSGATGNTASGVPAAAHTVS